MSADKVVGLLLAALAAISMGLATWAVKSTHDTAIRLALIEAVLEDISQDHATDERQDDTLERNTRLATWGKDRINDVRFEVNRLHPETDLRPVTWPDSMD